MKSVITQEWSSVIGHLPAGTFILWKPSSGSQSRDDGAVKLTPATERHVYFPASMHDVPPAARRKGERLRKNEARGVLENLKVELVGKGRHREGGIKITLRSMMLCAFLAPSSGANCGARERTDD